MSANPRASQSLVLTPAAAAAQSETPHGFIEMLLGFAKYMITVSQILLHWMLATSRLLETGQGSDMTVTCKGKVFKIHSAIVASRSDFFATACWGGFKEAENHCIDLPDDDPAAVGTMLQYFYTLKYDVHDDCFYDNREEQFPMRSDEELAQTPHPQLVFDIAIYRTSHKYNIPNPKIPNILPISPSLSHATPHVSAPSHWLHK